MRSEVSCYLTLSGQPGGTGPVPEKAREKLRQNRAANGEQMAVAVANFNACE